MFYNKSTYDGMHLTESVVAEEVSGNPLQFAIEAAEMDHKLFDALMAVDISEAAHKAGLHTLSESDLAYMKEASETGIVARIKALIEKFKEAVKKLFAKITGFVSNLVANDQKLYDSYKEYVTADKIGKCPVKGDTPSKEGYNKVVDAYTSLMDLAVATAQDTSNFATVNKNIASMQKQLDLIKTTEVVNSEDKPMVQKYNFENVVDTMKTGYKKFVEKIKLEHGKTENLIKNAQADAQIAAADAEKKSDLNRANKAYEALSKTLQISSQACSAFVSVASKTIALERAYFLKVGNWVKKGAKVNESYDGYEEIHDTLIEMSCDQFVDSAWEVA